MAGSNRTELNTHDTPFYLRFVERIYAGSPRWWSDEWRDHSSHGDLLDREQEVTDLIRLAGDFENRKFKKYYNDDTPFLVSCVNPNCPLRSWFLVEREDISTPGHKAYKWVGDKDERNGGLQAMATGNARYFSRNSCPRCSHKRAVFGFSEIKNKWVYVLRENGGSLIPHQEIEIWDGDTGGIIRHEFAGGHFGDKTQGFNGQLALPDIKNHTWHFFLSPVRLGSQALKLLQQAPSQDAQYAKKRDAAEPGKWEVAVFPELELQPWTTTVKRRFQAEQLKTPGEFVPLVDAFSWVAQIAEFDFLPILAAQQKLVQNQNEEDKAFIASTLAQVIGQSRDKDNPERTSPDPWKVAEYTAPIPSRYGGPGKNIAEAWVDRYHAAMEFLTKETNNAYCRVFFPVRFSQGHRVVEMACQENTTDAEAFGLGLAQWAHILRDAMVCQAGRTFTAWAARNKEAAERIPQKNVLGGAGLGHGAKLAGEIGHGLPVHILAYLSPALIAGSANPAQDMSKYLKKLDIETKTIGLKHVVSATNLSLDLAKLVIGSYIKKLPAVLDPDESRKALGLARWRDGIQSFGFLRDVYKAISLFADLDEWVKGGEKGEKTGWSRFKGVKKKIETSVSVAEYLTEKAHKLVKSGIKSQKGHASFDELKFETKLAEKMEAGESLSAFESEAISASRSLSALKVIGQMKKFLAGPVCFLIGACEMGIQLAEMTEAWESGDPLKAAASGVEALGNALIVEIAAIETVAWVFGIEALAAGPVGWVAAALIFTGGIMGIFAEKNDLQSFTESCFLGNKFKKRADWQKNLPDPHSPRVARFALLRLLTKFVTRTGMAALREEATAQHGLGQTGFMAGGVGCIIFPTYVPAGAYFEVEIDWAPKGHEPSKMQGYKARIWPMDGTDGDYLWLGQGPDDGTIDVVRNGSKVSRIQLRVKLKAGGPVDFNCRIRLVYESSGKNALPADGWVENRSVDASDGYNDVSS